MAAADVLVLKVVPYLTLGVHGSGGHAELARTSVHTSRLLTTAAKIINIEPNSNVRCHISQVVRCDCQMSYELFLLAVTPTSLDSLPHSDIVFLDVQPNCRVTLTATEN